MLWQKDLSGNKIGNTPATCNRFSRHCIFLTSCRGEIPSRTLTTDDTVCTDLFLYPALSVKSVVNSVPSKADKNVLGHSSAARKSALTLPPEWAIIFQMADPVQIQRNLRSAMKEALRIQDRFLAEPVFARTGQGYLKSEGVGTLHKIKAKLRRSPLRKPG